MQPSSRHSNAVGSFLDQLSFLMVYPWATVLSKLVAYYVPSTQPIDWSCKLTERFVFGPVLLVLFLPLLPIGISGFGLWMFVCTFFPQQNFSYLHINSHQQQTSSKMNNGKRVVTLATTNIMLANEFFCRLKNNRHPLLRSKFIGKQLLKQSSTYLNNFSPSMRRDECVIEDLPDVDILCIQEVWERYWASSMIGHLRAKYNYFIHDVGEFSLCTNYCLFGSGLFVACKYPVEAADFKSFRFKKRNAKFFSYGVLCMKIRIDGKRVAYVTNVHCQAYQGKKAVHYHQLSEILSAVNAFRLKNMLLDDDIIFDAICGDLSIDNLSPGDEAARAHPIFNLFVDTCSLSPGVDHPWTVGTKLRQQRMHEPAVCTPVSLRNVLLDDCRRRHYILDADVPKQAKSQSFVEEPAPNQEGDIVAETWGGKRRIDRILVRRDSPVKIVGYAFSTALAGLTDHIPVALSLQSTKS